MAIRTTRWQPDTCGCELEYSWDDSLPDNQRTHNIANVVKTCEAHQGLATISDKWNTIIEENPRKNQTLDEILTRGPSSIYDESGGSRKLKQGILLNWSWSSVAPNRALTVWLTGFTLTQQQTQAVQTFLNNRFGAGKVTIVAQQPS